MVLTIWLSFCSWWIIQKSQKCIFEWSKGPKKRFLAIFRSLVCWADLILHIMIELNVFQHLPTSPGRKGSVKIRKKHFWMIQRAKIEVFGHFLEFGLLDRLDIAYCDRTKCFPTFGNLTRSRGIIQKSQKSIFEWSKGQKERFLANFWSLVGWIDLISHIVIKLIVLQFLGTSPGH